MPIIAKVPSGSDYIPAPEGTFSAVCCDVVDLGMLEVTFGGKTKNQHKIWIVWQIDEVMADNRPYTVRKRYTLSLHEKAALRKDLESWRGRAFTAAELEGFDVESVISVACLLNVIHAAGSKGGTFANVSSIMRLPKGMNAISVRDYVRVKDRTPAQAEAVTEGPQWDGGITDDDVPFSRPRPRAGELVKHETLLQVRTVETAQRVLQASNDGRWLSWQVQGMRESGREQKSRGQKRAIPKVLRCA